MMEWPPSKRLKGQNCDPFGDEGDFTQDDLDQIDVMASQAVTEEPAASPSQCPGGAGGLQAVRRPAFRGPGVGEQQYQSDEFYCEELQAQQAELKRKLQEVEEELLMKNGEIQVLRDSLRQSRQEKEQQRQAQALQEQERAQMQSEREKVLSRKVQSLQSELHFKEAEINEMKTRLQNSERVKPLALPATRNSPKGASLPSQFQEGDGAQHSSSGLSRFLTKEAFGAQLAKAKPPLRSTEDRKPANETINHITADSQRGKLSSLLPRHSQGSSLLKHLLQHPLDPSTLSLCHLLCISPDALSGSLFQHDSLSPGSTIATCGSPTEMKILSGPHGSFGRTQSLAMCGLSALVLARAELPLPAPRLERSCPEALHLLPLLQHHVDLFCQALQTSDSSGGSPSRDGSLSNSFPGGGLSPGAEETVGTLEEFALAALGALCHLVAHSEEVVSVLLSPQTSGHAGGGDMEKNGPGSTLPEPSRWSRDEGAELQHPLLRRLLQLADPGIAGGARRRDAVLTSSLKVLSGLVENSDGELLGLMKRVLSCPSLAWYLSADTSYQTVSLFVGLLALAASNDELAMQLCSHKDPCPLLRIFHYVTSRPSLSITDSQWCQVELEVVRLLTELFTTRAPTWTAFTQSSCRCNSEVVRTLVVILHRRWLEGQSAVWRGPGANLLKETLVLLHWLSLNDAAFSQHCLDVLHMYDQVVPAIRDSFRKIPNLTETEDLALEEMCRPESEDCEDMDVDSGS